MRKIESPVAALIAPLVLTVALVFAESDAVAEQARRPADQNGTAIANSDARSTSNQGAISVPTFNGATDEHDNSSVAEEEPSHNPATVDHSPSASAVRSGGNRMTTGFRLNPPKAEAASKDNRDSTVDTALDARNANTQLGAGKVVSFHSSGYGIDIKPRSVDKGQVLELPRNSDPRKVFTGWYRDKALTDKIPGSELSGVEVDGPAITVNDSLELWAGWADADYFIQLDPTDKGRLSTNRIAALSNKPVVIPVPLVSGDNKNWQFDTWLRKGGTHVGPVMTLSSHEVSALGPSRTLPLLARWVGRELSVTLIPGPGSVESENVTLRVRFGDEIVPRDFEAKPGFYFHGWVTPDDKIVHFPLKIEKDTTLIGAWIAGKFKVNFKLNGQGGNDYSRYASPGRPLLVRDPIASGWVFEGWFTSPTFEKGTRVGEKGFFHPEGNTTLYAKWRRSDLLTVSFGMARSSVEGPASMSVVPKETIILPSPPVPEGTPFVGWKNANSDIVYPAGSSYTVKESTKFTAVYGSDVYTVAFNTAGRGEDITPISVVKGAEIALPVPERDGSFDFGGWYTDPEFSEKVDSAVTVNQDLILYAKWVSNETVTLTLDYGHGLTPLMLSSQVGEDVTLPKREIPGLVFEGWFTDNKFTHPAVNPYPATKPETLYAKFSKANEPGSSFAASPFLVISGVIIAVLIAILSAPGLRELVLRR